MSTTQVATAFLSSQLAFEVEEGHETTFADNPVPGIGGKGREALEAEGITNAAQVTGYYLRVNGDDEKMCAFLVDRIGCHGPSVKKDGSGTLSALREKCGEFVLEEPDAVGAAAPDAAGTTHVFANFLSKQLSWKDDFDSFPVPGLGKVGRAKLVRTPAIHYCLVCCRLIADRGYFQAESKFNITNPAQLIGHYMSLNGDDEEFVEFLVTHSLGLEFLPLP